MQNKQEIEMAVVSLQAEVARPVADVWPMIGGFFDLSKWLDVECRRLSGDGDVGSLRLVGNAIIEPLVARSATSYSYAQIRGPMAQYYYHGTVSCSSAGSAASTIDYTLLFDASSMTIDVRAREEARLSKRFGGALDAMVREVSR